MRAASAALDRESKLAVHSPPTFVFLIDNHGTTSAVPKGIASRLVIKHGKRRASIIPQEGVEAWNRWRKQNLQTKPNLRGANLGEADLTGANLREADLEEAKLIEPLLTKADLTEANLTGAELSGAHLTGAKLSGASLICASLISTDFSGANLTDCSI